MNTTAVVITAIIFGSSVVCCIIMGLIEHMEFKYNAGVKMEDKLKLEIVETLVDICFALDDASRYYHRNPRNLKSHADSLAMLSSEYREKIIPTKKVITEDEQTTKEET